MRPFEYQRADSSGAAVALLKDFEESAILAGGTGLVDLMKEGVSLPSVLVDVSRLNRSAVREEPGSLLLGAGATNTQVAYSDLVERHFPVLSQAILSGASAQLRNRATVAGNLMQRTRCPYFRGNDFACNKRRPGSGCDALEGYNRYHAILGTSSSCIASHPSDMCVALAITDAEIQVEGDSGQRSLQFRGFHKMPGKTPAVETALSAHDVITSLRVKKEPLLRNSLYLKLRDRDSYAFAVVSVAIAAVFRGNSVKECRVALGGVGTVPWRATRLESALVGQSLDEGTVKAAVKAEMAGADLREHNGFKALLAERAVWRTLSNLHKGVRA